MDKQLIDDENILHTVEGGVTYIALKPLCEMFGVTYERQREQVHKHVFLKEFVREVQLSVKGVKPVKKGELHPLAGGRNPGEEGGDGVAAPEYRQKRSMLCLPEQLIYGWMMELPVTNEVGAAFKWSCYQALWEKFRPASEAAVRDLVQQRIRLERKQQMLQQKMADNPVYMDLLQVEDQIHRLRNAQKTSMKKHMHQVEMHFTEADNKPLLNA
jgi:hypothetical protein